MKPIAAAALFLLTLFGGVRVGAGEPADPFEAYLDRFFESIPPLPASDPTNSVSWSAPRRLSMPDGRWFDVDRVSDDGRPIFETYSISSEPGVSNGVFRIYRVPTAKHARCAVESALSLPRSIPAQTFAAMLHAESSTNGTYCIAPGAPSPGLPDLLLLYENMAIGLFWSGEDRKDIAFALFRAGGVDIPGDPPPSGSPPSEPGEVP